MWVSITFLSAIVSFNQVSQPNIMSYPMQLTVCLNSVILLARLLKLAPYIFNFVSAFEIETVDVVGLDVGELVVDTFVVQSTLLKVTCG